MLFGFGGDDIVLGILGDSGVGKTSLITTLISESFPDTRVCHVMRPIVVPGDITPEGKSITLIDTEVSEPLSKNHAYSVVLLICDASLSETIDRISSHWLPLLTPLDIPIMIGVNKIDLSSPSELEWINERLMKLRESVPQIERIINCSAKQLLDVQELFYYGQKAVLYPTLPLFSDDRKHLSEDVVRRLHRVFILVDSDADGRVGRKEFKTYQAECFGQRINDDEVDYIHQLLLKEDPGFVVEDGITLQGFIWVHLHILRKHRARTQWEVLHYFGYDHTLNLRKDYIPTLPKRRMDTFFELTTLGYRFLEDLFKRFDTDSDGALNPQELEELLYTCTSTRLSKRLIDRDFQCHIHFHDSGDYSLEGWLAMWSFFTYSEPRLVVQFFIYMGYPTEHLLENLFNLDPLDNSRTVRSVHMFSHSDSLLLPFVKSLVSNTLSNVPKVVCGELEDMYIIVTIVPVDIASASRASDLIVKTNSCLMMVLYDQTPSSTSYVTTLIDDILPETVPIAFWSSQEPSPDLIVLSNEYHFEIPEPQTCQEYLYHRLKIP